MSFFRNLSILQTFHQAINITRRIIRSQGRSFSDTIETLASIDAHASAQVFEHFFAEFRSRRSRRGIESVIQRLVQQIIVIIRRVAVLHHHVVPDASVTISRRIRGQSVLFMLKLR